MGRPVYLVNGMGDGVADDTEALQTALERASEHGGDVVIPPARYRFTRPLRVSGDDVTIRGSGPEDSVLHADWGAEQDTIAIAAIGDPDLESGRRRTGLRLVDFAIEGRRAFSPTGHHIAVGMYEDVEIRGVHSRGANCMGIALGLVRGVVVADCVVSGAGADGIHVTMGASHVVVEDNLLVDTNDDGVGIGWEGPASDVTIRRNVVRRSGSRGIAVHGPCERVTAEDNSIESTWLAGIVVDCWKGSVRNVALNGNRIVGAGNLTDAPSARGQGVAGGIVVLPSDQAQSGAFIDGLQIRQNVLKDVRNSYIVIGPVQGPPASRPCTGVVIEGNLGESIRGTGGLGAANGDLGGESRDPVPPLYPALWVRGTTDAHITNNSLRVAERPEILLDRVTAGSATLRRNRNAERATRTIRRSLRVSIQRST